MQTFDELLDEKINKILEEKLKEFEKFKEFVSEYITEVDEEIKGYRKASKFLGISEQTLGRLVKENRVPFKKTGKCVSFSRKDLIEWKKERRIGQRYPINRI